MRKFEKPPYRGENGIWLTEAIFWDRWKDHPVDRRVNEPVFSLFAEKPGLICCRTTFVQLRDPTGRKWALTYLGDWEHWLRLMKTSWFREAYESWVAELNQQLKSEAIAVALEIMKGENSAQALAAAKFIANAEYDKPTKGRPSKSELTGELKRAAQALEIEDEDMARIGLKLINGGKK